jgi:hypothetical protein
MPDGETPIPPFWINDRDRHGRPLEPAVIEAARAIWDRAHREVIFRLKDPGRAPEIIEATAVAVSRALQRAGREPIRDVEAYLAWACIRRINRIAVRENREQTGHEIVTLEVLSANKAGRTEDNLVDELYVKELLSNMDTGTREIFMLRATGYSWGEIAKMRGYASPHSAEVQFGKKWKAVKARIERLSRREAGPFGRRK